MVLDTGTQRSVMGHALSGAIAGFLTAGFVEDVMLEEEKKTKRITRSDLFFNAVKTGILTASAVAATNALGDSSKSMSASLLSASSSIALGALCIYGANIIQRKVRQYNKDKSTELLELKNSKKEK